MSNGTSGNKIGTKNKYLPIYPYTFYVYIVAYG